MKVRELIEVLAQKTDMDEEIVMETPNGKFEIGHLRRTFFSCKKGTRYTEQKTVIIVALEV